MAGEDGKLKYLQNSAGPSMIYDSEGRRRYRTRDHAKSRVHHSGDELFKSLEAVGKGDWGPYKERYPEHAEEVDLLLSGQHSYARENPQDPRINPQPNQATESAKNNVDSNDEAAQQSLNEHAAQQFLNEYKAKFKYMN